MIINTEHAPAPVGPYSQAVKAGNILFVSGQVGINPETNTRVQGGIKKEVNQTLNNINAIVQKAGISLHDIVKVTVYLKDITDFSAMNEVYSQFFSEHKPARACIEANLVKDFLVEIDAFAVK